MLRRKVFFGLAVSLLAVLTCKAPAAAQNSTLLRIEGDLQGQASVEFDVEALLALPRQDVVTETIWTSGIETFSGPALADVLEAAGAGDGDLRLVALNDYAVKIPREVVEDSLPIVAVLRDGARFGVRDKGPLWIIFPYDAEPRFRNEQIFAYSIWQLVSIEVLPES
jgi:hypothetical protein